VYKDKTATFYEEGNPDIVLDAKIELNVKVNKIFEKLREKRWIL